MNLGRRIAQRLAEIGQGRAYLLDRVPDLSAQALSNLIRRDSVRSEWDVAIAKALGVHVMWLVYGEDPSTYSVPSLASDVCARDAADIFAANDSERELLRAYRRAAPKQRAAFMALADSIPPDPASFEIATGTH